MSCFCIHENKLININKELNKFAMYGYAFNIFHCIAINILLFKCFSWDFVPDIKINTKDKIVTYHVCQSFFILFCCLHPYKMDDFQLIDNLWVIWYYWNKVSFVYVQISFSNSIHIIVYFLLLSSCILLYINR